MAKDLRIQVNFENLCDRVRDVEAALGPIPFAHLDAADAEIVVALDAVRVLRRIVGLIAEKAAK